MIYIDPPYNTGSDGFVYNDSFNFKVEDFMQLANVDEDEAKKILDYTTSKRSSHSAWLTFMYPRLYIARELLKDDGVIFISIDDNEQAQLKLLCDEIFGEDNFIDCFLWNKGQGNSLSKFTRNDFEYVLCYSKNKDSIQYKFKGDSVNSMDDSSLLNKTNKFSKLVFPKGSITYKKEKSATIKPFEEKDLILHNKMIVENNLNENDVEISANFKWGQEYLNEQLREGTKIIAKTNKLRLRYIKDKANGEVIVPTKSITSNNNVGFNISASSNLNILMGNDVFSHPKPTSLINYLISMVCQQKDIVLDFFSGSGTTGEAVFEQNTYTNKELKFIMVQLDEQIKLENKEMEKNERKIMNNAYDFCKKELKSKNPMIPDIAKERIKRAAKKIKEENKDKKYINDIDFGFKVYKTIEDKRTKLSDIKEFDVNQKLLFDTDNLEALLTTWMLYDGYDLNTKVENFSINKYNGYLVESTLYLMDKDFSTKDLKTLVEKLSDEQTPIINRIVVNESNFTNKMLAEINEQVFDKNIKEVNINVIKRV